MTRPRQTLVLASGNPGKLREFAGLLAPLQIDLQPQSAWGIGAIAETGSSFVENALLKARHACSLSGCSVLADDSGLCVDALGGAPGLYSARYAGNAASDSDNNGKLLAQLEGVADAQRQAHYVAVLVLLRWAADPDPLIACGRWHGRILRCPRGDGGFGYDPLFLDLELQRSAAELSAEEKAQRSHRGQAWRALLQQWPRH